MNEYHDLAQDEEEDLLLASEQEARHHREIREITENNIAKEKLRLDQAKCNKIETLKHKIQQRQEYTGEARRGRGARGGRGRGRGGNRREGRGSEREEGRVRQNVPPTDIQEITRAVALG